MRNMFWSLIRRSTNELKTYLLFISKPLDPPQTPNIEVSSPNSENVIYSHFNHIKEYFEAIVETGQEIQINCHFDDNKGELNAITQLDTKITIRKNGKPIRFAKEYYNGIHTRVTANNNGDKYECEVDNRFYSRTSNTVALNVHCKF